MADKESRRNAYVYAKLRDRQYERYDRHAHANGLSMKAFLVVNALYYAPSGLVQSRICEMTFNSRQTVSLVAKRLIAKGYAEARNNPCDRRNSIVCLTDAGRAWAHDMVRRITCAEDEAMSMLAPEEQARLIELSRRFTENLIALIDNPDLPLGDE